MTLKNLSLVAILSLGFSQALMAQVPATTNIAGSKYPAIFPDNKIEFRLKAPEAQKVQVDICGKKYDMSKNAEGEWSAVSDPIVSGIQYYSLIVDGVSVNDPASETFYGCGRMMSCVEVPYLEGGQQYQIKDVPHGCVRTENYFSKVTNSWRTMYVYTPAGYDTDVTKKYPVFYIIHGGGEDCRGWVNQGRGNIILDNLSAEKKAVPMILVSLDANVGDYDNVEKEIMDNIVPFVEKNYRVDARLEKRALGGLSMGGLYTMYVGFPHNDFFAYFGVFSSGWFANMPANTDNPGAKCYSYLEKNAKTFNKNVKLLWMGQGSPTDIAWNNCQVMMKKFDEMNIKYKYFESKEGGHTWPVWREDLYLFAQEIFK
ncbi:MAG: esterase [Bacteroidales bacterium]|nr:esterase [Bacteroidales bacterium]